MLEFEATLWDGRKGVVNLRGFRESKFGHDMIVEGLRREMDCTSGEMVREIRVNALRTSHLNLLLFTNIERIAFNRRGRPMDVENIYLPSTVQYTLEDVPAETVAELRCSSRTTITNMEELLDYGVTLLMSDSENLFEDRLELRRMRYPRLT